MTLCGWAGNCESEATTRNKERVEERGKREKKKKKKKKAVGDRNNRKGRALIRASEMGCESVRGGFCI
jgi:hypothetical protein